MKETKDKKFGVFFQRHQELVLKMLVCKVRNYDVAQDICQDTFCKLYSHINEIEEKNIKGWLLITARNGLIDYLRAAKKKKTEYLFDGDTDQVANVADKKSSKDFMINEIVRRDLIMKILKELENVNEGWYRIITLTVLMGKSQEEAAQDMGISVEVLRARLCRARKWIDLEYGREYREALDLIE